MPQRRKNEPGGRTIVHKVKVSQAEEDALQTKANALGVTVSRLLAESALETTPAVAKRVWTNELLAIRQQVRHLGETDRFDPEMAKNCAIGIDKFLAGAR